MERQFEAIYENGVLRPLELLSLENHQRVKLTLAEESDQGWMDLEFMNSCSNDSETSVDIADVRRVMSKIKGSMAQVVSDLRGEY